MTQLFKMLLWLLCVCMFLQNGMGERAAGWKAALQPLPDSCHPGSRKSSREEIVSSLGATQTAQGMEVSGGVGT